ncbi:hypothetical protein ACFSUS_14395 [Spirosoma soli]|uniref:Uncharacterized protein n=1 Tax=Spirosoma soli TaxID=1770529 RepID=A0ABW5M490_9BACT
MQHPTLPLILLYDVGLISQVSNRVLLCKQSHQRSIHEYAIGSSAQLIDDVVWQPQISDCKRVRQQKHSLIRQLERAPNAPPYQASIGQNTTSK